MRARIALSRRESCQAGPFGRRQPSSAETVHPRPASVRPGRAADSERATQSVQNAKRGLPTRAAQCDFAPSASFFSRSIVLGPMPLIPRRSSQRVNDLLPVRAFEIRSASTGPMPGRRTSESVGALERNRRGSRQYSAGTVPRARSRRVRADAAAEVESGRSEGGRGGDPEAKSGAGEEADAGGAAAAGARCARRTGIHACEMSSILGTTATAKIISAPAIRRIITHPPPVNPVRIGAAKRAPG